MKFVLVFGLLALIAMVSADEISTILGLDDTTSPAEDLRTISSSDKCYQVKMFNKGFTFRGAADGAYTAVPCPGKGCLKIIKCGSAIDQKCFNIHRCKSDNLQCRRLVQCESCQGALTALPAKVGVELVKGSTFLRVRCPVDDCFNLLPCPPGGNCYDIKACASGECSILMPCGSADPCESVVTRPTGNTIGTIGTIGTVNTRPTDITVSTTDDIDLTTVDHSTTTGVDLTTADLITEVPTVQPCEGYNSLENTKNGFYLEVVKEGGYKMDYCPSSKECFQFAPCTPKDHDSGVKCTVMKDGCTSDDKKCFKLRSCADKIPCAGNAFVLIKGEDFAIVKTDGQGIRFESCQAKDFRDRECTLVRDCFPSRHGSCVMRAPCEKYPEKKCYSTQPCYSQRPTAAP